MLLFHHIRGLTEGVVAFADRLREAGHEVSTPDLFEGAQFASIEEGAAYVEGVGFGTIAERGAAAASAVEGPLVVGGFSLGVLPAQKTAQTRSDVVGAILYHGAVPAEVFGDEWPKDVALQIHLGESDPFAEEDLPAARALVDQAGGDLFMYPTAAHLVTDSTSEDYDEAIAGEIVARSIAFLNGLG